jgi:hypothetical protein
MYTKTTQNLYNKLPEIYRVADFKEGNDTLLRYLSALDFLLFQAFNDTMEVSGNSKATRIGGDTMSAYFVLRIIKKGQISVEQGRAYYSQVKAQYPQYIDEVDFLLVSEGYENLIVK